MTPTKRAILAHYTDPFGLIEVARDLCAAASAALAAGDFLLGDALVDDAEEVLEIRSAGIAQAATSRRPAADDDPSFC